jgi:arabinose-5-phosphate isomerase
MTDSWFAEAKRVLEIERDWIDRTIELVAGNFDEAVETLADIRGKLVICGMGKSGHVARKIAATMTSTGTPAYFLHPVEGAHGDLGIIQRGDAALILSKSGDTPEIAALLPCFRKLDMPVVAMVSRTSSFLARAADVVLQLPDMSEACPHDLAPTASTTAMMALGDALAMALLRFHRFSPEEFAEVHPGGALGRKLLFRVRDLMTGPPLPLVDENSLLPHAIETMTSNRGVCISTDSHGKLTGIFVYGDLGRLMRNKRDISDTTIGNVLVRDPVTASEKELAAVAVSRMEDRGITSLVVVDQEGTPVGILHLHDALRAGVR